MTTCRSDRQHPPEWPGVSPCRQHPPPVLGCHHLRPALDDDAEPGASCHTALLIPRAPAPTRCRESLHTGNYAHSAGFSADQIAAFPPTRLRAPTPSQDESTEARHRGGATRSSWDVGETRPSEGVASSSEVCPSTRKAGERAEQAKSFDISKWEVWEAYQRVRANQGGSGSILNRSRNSSRI